MYKLALLSKTFMCKLNDLNLINSQNQLIKLITNDRKMKHIVWGTSIETNSLLRPFDSLYQS